MASNRFDQAHPQSYVSQYIRPPFEAISAMGEKANKNFEEGKKLEDDLGLLGQTIKAAPMYELHKQQFVNSYNKKINDLVDESKGDYGSPEFKRKAHKLITEFKTAPEIDAFAQTKKAFEDYQSEKKDTKNAMNLDWTYQKDKNGNYVPLDVNKQGIYSPKFTQYEDWNKTAKDVMGKVNDSGYSKETGMDFSNPMTRISNGETEVYAGKTNGWVGVSDPRVQNLSKMMASEYANTTAGKHHLQSLLGTDIDYKTLSIQAQNDPEVAKTKKAVDDEFANHMYRANANQIGGVTSSSIDYHFQNDRKAAAANDQKEANKYLPSFEGNISPTPSTPKNALSTIGMKSDFMDDEGNIKYNSNGYQPSLKDVEKELNRLKAVYKGNESNPDYMQELQRVKAGFIATKANKEIANNYYSDMVRSASNLGIDPKQYMTNGKVDYKALKDDLVSIGQNLNTEAGSIQGLQAKFTEDLSKFYFGETTGSGENAKFKTSPVFQKLSIYENNNPSSKDKIESEEKAAKLAQNAKFIGLDFNDKNLGSLAFTATEGNNAVEPKLYNAVTPDKTLKTLMEPVHTFSQEMSKTVRNRQTKEEVEANKLDAKQELENIATAISNGNDPNKAAKLAALEKVAYGINYGSDKGLVIGNNNDRSKLFIGQPQLNGGKVQNTVYSIDVINGTVDIVDLGKVQNEESTNIQNKIAPAYNTGAQGYQNKDIQYK